MDTKDIAKNIGLAAAVSVVFFVLIEVVLHGLYPLREFNPPNARYELAHPEYNMTITTNSFGLRDKDYTLDVPDGEYRILVVGDSFVFGVGAQNNETFPKVLERKLNENSSGVQYEVLNAGKSGTGPREYVELLKHYSEVYDYNMTIVAIYAGNDIIDSKDPYINEGLISLLKKSRIVTMTFNFVTSISQRNKKSKISNILVFNAKRAPQFYRDSLLLESSAVKESMGEMMRAVLEIDEFLHERGKKMVVLIIPSALQVDKRYHAFFADTGFQVTDEFLTNPRVQEVLGAFFEKRDIEYIDLLGDFKRENDGLFFLTDDHVNVNGQEFIGAALAERLRGENVSVTPNPQNLFK